MESALPRPVLSRGALWTARSLTALAVLFWLFDSVGHIVKPQPVIDAFARLGMPLSLSVAIGLLELLLLAIYLVPRTAVFGAVLLTGYLGGATALQMRAGSSAFETIFPILFGVLVWAPVYLREQRVRELLPTLAR